MAYRASQAFLETAEINASDAWTLFASLDVDGDRLVDVEDATKILDELIYNYV